MDKDDDPWEILGVPRDASEADIKKAFRKGALIYHPDKQQTEEDKAAAHDIFAKLSAAYETLNDPVKRYDWRMAEEKRLAKSSRPSTAAPAAKKKPAVARPSTAQTEQRRTSAPPPPRTSNSTSPKPGRAKTSPSPSGQKGPPPSKRPSAPVTSGGRKANLSPTPPSQAQRKAASQPRGTSPKRHSVPVQAQNRPPPPKSDKRRSAPPTPTTMGWQRQTPQKKSQPVVKIYRDPFDIFESVMKEEYGDDYKNRDESGWKGSIGVPGLAKINPFKKKTESSTKEFKKLDVNNDKTLSRDELGKYIESHSDLWSTLGMNLSLPVKKCIEVATDVAFSLAFGEGKTRPKKNEHRKRRELTEAEFKYFHKNYVLDEKGSHEFFLRTIFSVFDLNNDGVLSAKELDKFLDIFYKAKEVFKGDMKLPEKKHLLKIVGTRLDSNKDGALQFHEIRDLLEVAAVVSTEK